VFCFFFSSRRRHTRFSRDWSSDVCSSDLNGFSNCVIWPLLMSWRFFHCVTSSLVIGFYNTWAIWGVTIVMPHQNIIVTGKVQGRSEEHTSELQSRENLVCRLLLEKKKKST